MRKIGVFGGTFNPIHVGHVLAIEEFIRTMQLDMLYVIPAAIPPHKQLPQGSADASTRLRMVCSAVAHLPNVIVSDIELCREGKSYTSDTLRQLRQMHADDTIYLLLGTDSFLRLDSWHEPEVICELATLVCAHRQSDSKQVLSAQADYLHKQYRAKSVILDNRYEEISSSDVRRLLVFDSAKQFLSESVYALIQKEGLYAVRENRKNLPFSTLQEQSLALHDEKRVHHAIGCAQTAVKLARCYGANEEDAARAGILHDVTKALQERAQIAVCSRYNMEPLQHEADEAKLLHARTGALVAKHIFGENEQVCEAIRWHTTANAEMSLLQKIIYIADYIEPTRDFPGVEELRAAAWESIDKAMRMGLQMTITMLSTNNRKIDRHSVAAMKYFSAIETEESK